MKIEHNLRTVLTDLKSCSIKRDLEWGRRLHEKALTFQKDLNSHLASSLIKMYSKCSSMVEAHKVFESVKNPDVVVWTALLLGYAENREGATALKLFSRMKSENCVPNSVTYLAVLKACSCLDNKQDSLKTGREIHLELGCLSDRYVQSTLIDMYSKCGSMLDARHVFDIMQKPDVVSWTTLLLGYAENGEGLEALKLFEKMKKTGCMPNSVTYIAALKACTSLAKGCTEKLRFLEDGRKIHMELGFQADTNVKNTLIDMYAKCGSIVDAQQVFDSMENPVVVSWNALILGYAENGQEHRALGMFLRMKASKCAPNSQTYVAVLRACTSMATNGDDKKYSLQQGREIHSEIRDVHMNHYVRSALVDMYAKSGRMAEAQHLFDDFHKTDVVSWNALLMGYVENGESNTALKMYSKMKVLGCTRNSVTHIAALKACCLIGSLAHGQKIHSEICDFDGNVVTCLVDLYAKCGSIEEAREVFDLHANTRIISTWNALLLGYGSCGNVDCVFETFKAMQDEGHKPNDVTFVCLLLSCSHAGLVEKTWQYFEAMLLQYGVAPTVMHYTCMVDALGRANRLGEAVAMLRNISNPDAVTWMTLLGACCKWKNVEIGRLAFQFLAGMKKYASIHIQMAQLCGSRGMWMEEQKVIKGWKLLGDSNEKSKQNIFEAGCSMKYRVHFSMILADT